MNLARLIIMLVVAYISLAFVVAVSAQEKQEKTVIYRNNTDLYISVLIGTKRGEADLVNFILWPDYELEAVPKLRIGKSFVTIRPLSLNEDHPLVHRKLKVTDDQAEYTITIDNSDIKPGPVPKHPFLFLYNVIGRWEREDGFVVDIKYEKEEGKFSGRISRLPDKIGRWNLDVGHYFMFLRRVGFDTYDGFMMSSSDTMNSDPLVVRGDTMLGSWSGTWKRVGSIPTDSIFGLWRSRFNLKVKFVLDGTKVIGTVVRPARTGEFKEYSVGDKLFELSETSLFVYSGKIMRRNEQGETRWEDTIMRVADDLILLDGWELMKMRNP